MSVIVPEVILQDAVQKILTIIRDDWVNTSPSGEANTLLYKILSGVIINENYDLFEQAKTVMLGKENDDPRFIRVFLSYDKNDTQYPSIHVTLPNEDAGVVDGLGFGQNDVDDNPSDVATDYSKSYNRSFNARYNLVILSDNRNESTLIYHAVKAGLIALNEHLDLSGLKNLRISGSELNWQAQVPPGVFARSISLGFFYDINVPEFTTQPVVKTVNLQYILTDEIT